MYKELLMWQEAIFISKQIQRINALNLKDNNRHPSYTEKVELPRTSDSRKSHKLSPLS